jgi:lysophospholipase L1-like esterase
MSFSPTSVYLFAGDSLTEGVYGESYVERIARALYRGQAGIQGDIVNAGRGCDTVRSLLSRIDELLQRYRPQWVVLAIGCNDVWLPWLSSHSLGWWLWLSYRRFRWGQVPAGDLDQFAAAYRALIDRCQTLAGAQVLACTVSPVGEQLASPVNHQLARLNGVIKHVAVDCQVPVADVWQAFVDQLAPLPQPSSYVGGEWLFSLLDRSRLRTTSPDEIARRRHLQFTFDGIHLSGHGADLWAATILKAMVQAQRQPIAVEFLP